MLTVFPPLALTVESKYNARDGESKESGRRREVSDRVEAERLGAVKADETGGKG